MAAGDWAADRVEAPSGAQHVIRFGGQEATVVEVGGGIRAYAAAGRDVLQPYARESMCDAAHGAPLIPWPNRLADGRYIFSGVAQQLSITEPAKGNAIHGLTRWRSWTAVERSEAAVTMALTLRPSTGYPHTLALRIRYELGPGGLVVCATARNIGADACPYAFGQHPYLSPGAGTLDDCRLEFGAGALIRTDPDRQLPVGVDVVERGSDYDFAGGRALRGRVLDDAFTELARDEDGRAWVILHCADGRRVRLWADESLGYLQVFSADTLAPGRRRGGIAVEPMTAPANAFASGEALISVEPGETVETTWGVVLD